MDERGYVARLWELWPQSGDSTCGADVLALSGRAVQDCPKSTALLCMRGDLLQLASPDYEAEDDPKGCYTRALEVDPQCSEAWESLGFYLDVFEDDYPHAIDAFRRALACGAAVDSVAGLARALAENGQIPESLRVIDDAVGGELSESDRRGLSELRDEIEAGDWSP